METCTKWDKIVSGEELAKIKTYRGKAYFEKKERRAALDELLGEGWEFFKEYKDNRFIGVRKLKKFDEQFEDRVWMLFAKMGFPYLNSDRHFVMSYNYQNPSLTQQIDVFAADEETVIIVEC